MIMKIIKLSAAPVRAFDRAYIKGQFVTPHGTQVVDLVKPTNDRVIGKVTMADEIDTRNASNSPVRSSWLRQSPPDARSICFAKLQMEH
jgi:acyl-CoA reductase-like NAD-dependent aldehyde dehydrogenase